MPVLIAQLPPDSHCAILSHTPPEAVVVWDEPVVLEDEESLGDPEFLDEPEDFEDPDDFEEPELFEESGLLDESEVLEEAEVLEELVVFGGRVSSCSTLVPTKITRGTGGVVILLLVFVRPVTLPSCRTSEKVLVRVPRWPSVSILVTPWSSVLLFLRTVR